MCVRVSVLKICDSIWVSLLKSSSQININHVDLSHYCTYNCRGTGEFHLLYVLLWLYDLLLLLLLFLLLLHLVLLFIKCVLTVCDAAAVVVVISVVVAVVIVAKGSSASSVACQHTHAQIVRSLSTRVCVCVCYALVLARARHAKKIKKIHSTMCLRLKNYSAQKMYMCAPVYVWVCTVLRPCPPKKEI